MRPSEWFAPWANGPWSDDKGHEKKGKPGKRTWEYKAKSMFQILADHTNRELMNFHWQDWRVRSIRSILQTDSKWVSGLDQFSSRLKDCSMCAITSSHHNKTPNNKIKRIYKTNIVPLDTTNHSIHKTTICKTNQHTIHSLRWKDWIRLACTFLCWSSCSSTVSSFTF